jgi:DNA-binding NtrC family response regulator
MDRTGTILIADPDTQFLSEWAKALKSEGFQIFTAQKTTQAIQIVQKEKVDLLILEAEMPEMRAYEAIPILKGVDPSLFIIITAAQNTPELEARIRHHPIFYYHIKTFGPEELKLAVINALERQAATKAK